MGLIYMRISPSGGKYIGQTRFLEKTRWKDHVSKAFDSNSSEYATPLSRAIRKYGSENFQVQILEENIPNENLSAQERYWINYYKSYIHDGHHGYNLTRGGEGAELYDTKQILALWNNGQSIGSIQTHLQCSYGTVIRRLKKINVPHDEIVKRGALITRMKLKELRKRQRRKIKNCIINLWDQGYGEGQIAEKLRMSDETIKRVLLEENISVDEIIRRGKQVALQKLQQTLQEKNKERDLKILEYWQSGLNITTINEKTNLSRETIQRSLNLHGIKASTKPNPARGYEVLQYDLYNNFIKEWPSASAAAKSLNLDSSTISKVCRGIKQTCGGFKWKRKT